MCSSHDYGVIRSGPECAAAACGHVRRIIVIGLTQVRVIDFKLLSDDD